MDASTSTLDGSFKHRGFFATKAETKTGDISYLLVFWQDGTLLFIFHM